MFLKCQEWSIKWTTKYFFHPFALMAKIHWRVTYTYQLDRLFCYSCHCHWPFRYMSCHRTEAQGCCTHACDFWLLRHMLPNMSPTETMVPNRRQLKGHIVNVWHWASWFQAHSSIVSAACEHPRSKDPRGRQGIWNFNGTGGNILCWFEFTFPDKAAGGQAKTQKILPWGIGKARGSLDACHKRSCNGDSAVGFRWVWLTGTGFSMAGLSLSPVALAVLASQLRHGSVAVTYSGDLSLATGHRAGGPRRPQTPASVLTNWD